MKEIGGYLELEEFCHQEYYPDLIALNTARNALLYLCRARKIRKLYLPYYLCDSVSNICNREGINYEYYHIHDDFTPIFNGVLKDGEYIYIVNYFGQLKRQYLNEYKMNFGNIIVDNVQAFFEQPIEGTDTIYSCRKFFGVPDGAYLSTNAKSLVLETDVSKGRMKHILGRYEGIVASEYYADFKTNDHSFVELELKSMSKLTHNLLGAVDYDKVMRRRNENWLSLHGGLMGKNKLRLSLTNAPYMYPFYCEDGIKMRKILSERKIFIPTLWPNVLEFTGCELEKDYVMNILPLPCDQRYTREDMERIIEEIQKCIS